jgi:hypothetical protein
VPRNYTRHHIREVLISPDKIFLINFPEIYKSIDYEVKLGELIEWESVDSLKMLISGGAKVEPYLTKILWRLAYLRKYDEVDYLLSVCCNIKKDELFFGDNDNNLKTIYKKYNLL